MDTRLRVLYLVLRELGIEPSVESIQQRMLIQKAVYLAQKLGVKLGYSYGWYLRGPYSPSLTQDYYEIASLDGDLDGQLKGPVVEKLQSVRNLMEQKPDDLNLAHWLELLSSIDYLKSRSSLTRAKIAERLQKNKPHLTDFLDEGFAALP